MRSFLLGAEREGAYNIPFKVERGEDMKTIVATTKFQDKIPLVGSAFDVAFKPNCNYILKKPSQTSHIYQTFMFQTDADGAIAGYAVRLNMTSQVYVANATTWAGVYAVNVGDEFYEIPREW